MTINFSLILPCYNEEENIFHLFNEFKNIPFVDEKAELIFVNNGSSDNTENEIDKIIIESKNTNNPSYTVRKLNLKTNQGYGGGIIAGLESATGNYIGWCHADLQTPIIDFYKLYIKIKNEDFVLGKGFRTNNRGIDGIVTRLHEIFATIILGHKMQEINAMPKIFTRQMLKIFDEMPKKLTLLDTYIHHTSLLKAAKVIEIDVEFKDRIYGQSKWKNNFSAFVKHIFFSFYYLLQLKFSKNKK